MLWGFFKINSYYGHDHSKHIKGRKIRICALLRTSLAGMANVAGLGQRVGEGGRWAKQVEGNEEYHGVIDDPSSALGILFQGLIFVIKQREEEAVRRGDGEVCMCVCVCWRNGG